MCFEQAEKRNYHKDIGIIRNLQNCIYTLLNNYFQKLEKIDIQTCINKSYKSVQIFRARANYVKRCELSGYPCSVSLIINGLYHRMQIYLLIHLPRAFRQHSDV